jgi:hypothetical protein
MLLNLNVCLDGKKIISKCYFILQDILIKVCHYYMDKENLEVYESASE